VTVSIVCESAIKTTTRIPIHWTLILTPTLDGKTVALATTLWSQPMCMQKSKLLMYQC